MANATFRGSDPMCADPYYARFVRIAVFCGMPKCQMLNI
jgi:hypothetical protein